MTSDFEVAEIRRPIFSVGVLEEHCWRVTLDREEEDHRAWPGAIELDEERATLSVAS